MFTKAGPTTVIQYADSYEVHLSILTAGDQVFKKGQKGERCPQQETVRL